MEAASPQPEEGNHTDGSPDPCGPRERSEQPEGEHDRDVRGNYTGSGWAPTHNLRKRYGNEHCEEDPGEIRISERDIGPDDTAARKVAAAKQTKGRLQNGHGAANE